MSWYKSLSDVRIKDHIVKANKMIFGGCNPMKPNIAEIIGNTRENAKEWADGIMIPKSDALALCDEVAWQAEWIRTLERDVEDMKMELQNHQWAHGELLKDKERQAKEIERLTELLESANKAIDKHIDELDQEIIENERLTKALEFYADPATYDFVHLSRHGYIIIDKDGGQVAREALRRDTQT